MEIPESAKYVKFIFKTGEKSRQRVLIINRIMSNSGFTLSDMGRDALTHVPYSVTFELYRVDIRGNSVIDFLEDMVIVAEALEGAVEFS